MGSILRGYKNLSAWLACAAIAFSLQFCNPEARFAGDITTSFYYYGNQKIYVDIPGDTLGFLLSADLVMPDSLSAITTSPAQQKRKTIDSILRKEGYEPAGYLPKNTGNIALAVLKKNKALAALDKETKRMKKKYPSLFFNAGYLGRLKDSKAPVIITDEISITFRPNTSDSLKVKLLEHYHLDTIRKHPYTNNKYLVTIKNNWDGNALEISQEMHNDSLLSWVNINLVFTKEFQSAPPRDPFYTQQWNLNNPGPSTAINSEDADIDADRAWEFTTGSDDVTIAVIDDAFQLSHEDLSTRFRSDGWNFIDNNNILIGTNFPSGHGTAVSGIIAAEQNSLGITGVAPGCRVLPLRTGIGSDGSRDNLAITRAIELGARVINCSWQPRAPIPDLLQSVTEAEQANVFFVCSMDNFKSNDPATSCNASSLCVMPTTFSVSRSNSLDNADDAGFGSCLDLLAPSCAFTTGLQKVITTDLMGADGYNMISFDNLSCPVITTDGNYTGCFWGTSAAAPLTAGVAALIISAYPEITAAQLRDLLQDCADKIDPSNADYSKVNGKSIPETHGFGRLNAYEAVKIASTDASKGGLNGYDVFIRDNDLDWGNTEKPSSYKFETAHHFQPHWVSPDIKIDAPDLANPANPFEPLVNDQTKFENLSDQSPIANTINKVYVRVRNRGFKTVSRVSVKLYWVYAGLALPSLWPGFPADALTDPTWHYIGTREISDLLHSGASVAGTGSDRTQIVSFDFTAPDPALNPVNHYCLLALLDSPDDPLPAILSEYTSLDEVTPNFNNVTHRNISILPGAATSKMELYLYNPEAVTINTIVRVDRPEGMTVKLSNLPLDSSIVMEPHQKRKFIIAVENGKNGSNIPREIHIIQEYMIGKRKIRGGNTLRF